MLAYSQSNCNSIFTGQILDESNKPVIGAAVLLLPGQTGQTSDSIGNFKFAKLCPGTYTVKVQYLGYQDEVLEVQISGRAKRVVRLREVTSELNEVVITGHHDAAHIENANNFVQLDEKQLAESAGKSLGEALKEVSGVNSIQTGPGIFKPVIHGVHSQRILILNYGIRQEGQQWGAEHAPEIDPFIASNIVVIKDASAIKYGTDALGGVIVVNPPELPTASALGGTIQTVLQSNGKASTISGMLEGGIKNHTGWGWRVQGTGRRTGDFNTPHYSLTNTGGRRQSRPGRASLAGWKASSRSALRNRSGRRCRRSGRCPRARGGADPWSPRPCARKRRNRIASTSLAESRAQSRPSWRLASGTPPAVAGLGRTKLRPGSVCQ